MYENHSKPLMPKRLFVLRLLKNALIGVILIALALFIGMLGYHDLEKMSWLDSFLNASMILSGMGPVGNLNHDSAKLFAGFYALFSGLFFILAIGFILAPVAHRCFHQFHLEEETVKKKLP